MMVGCSNDNLQRITDDNTSQAIFNYDFNYELYKPGTQMSCAYLWDGYDMNNKFGPNIAKENKLATYLNLYGDIEDYYYLAYISKDTIANGMEWLSNYEKIIIMILIIIIFLHIKIITLLMENICSCIKILKIK